MPTKGRVTATLQMTPDKDDDLIRWFRKLPKGERNEKLKNLLRAGLGKPLVDYHTSTPDGLPDRLLMLEQELERQAQWIEYLNSQFEGRTVTPDVATSQPDDAQTRVDDDVLQGRAAKLKRANW